MMSRMSAVLWATLLCGIAANVANAATQTCPHRGQLDDLYCDADRDMVADAPA